jgi:hypothetical protein
MSVIEDRLPYLEPLKLGRGSHVPPSNGLVNACVMEAVAYVAGEPFSDHPTCASPVITSFLVSWNDAMDDVDRQMLKPYIVRLVGTNTGKRHEEQRAWMLTDWLARECAPAWMRLAGLAAQAELLKALAPLTSAASARKAQPVLDAARKDSDAARDAAWAAAWDAAWAAARDAAWAAAGDAARAAARDAARAAARAAARDAAWAAAGDAARAAARDAAWAAAGDAARAAARDAARAAAWDAARAAAWAAARAAAGDAARAAAWAAARDALAPTTRGLQRSALLLLDRMIAVSARGGDAT